jgi:hypothetical protein
MYGSHEAFWAIHCEGWIIERLSMILKSIDFESIEVKKQSWKGIHNFEIIAKKNDIELSNKELENKVKDFLSDYLVDFTESEMKTLDLWMDLYNEQLNKSQEKTNK